jgi:hypothetical protein
LIIFASGETVSAKSCFGQLIANDIFFKQIQFANGKSSNVLNGYFAEEKGTDILFEQENVNVGSDHYIQNYLIVCPVPRGSPIVCNKSMIDLETQEKLSDQYGFQHEAIYTTIWIDPSNINEILIGKYNQNAPTSSSRRQFQRMQPYVMQSLSAASQKPFLQFEPVVGHIYLFNISKPLIIDGVPAQNSLYTYDIVKMMVVSIVGPTISIRWDVIYSSTGNMIECFIKPDASFSITIGNIPSNVAPMILGTHVAVFVSLIMLSLCMISMFIYQIFRCKCWQKNKYFSLD